MHSTTTNQDYNNLKKQVKSLLEISEQIAIALNDPDCINIQFNNHIFKEIMKEIAMERMKDRYRGISHADKVRFEHVMNQVKDSQAL